MGFLVGPMSLILCMVLGFLMKRARIFGPDAYQVVMKIFTTLSLPIVILYQYQNFERDHSLLTIILIGFLGSFISLFVGYFAAFKKNPQDRAFYMFHTSGYNIGGFTLPVVLALLGPESAMAVIFFDLGNALMLTGGSYAITTYLLPLEGSEAPTLADTLKKFLYSAPFMMYLFVLALYGLAIELPAFIYELIQPIAQANAFIATFMLGLMFQLPQTKAGKNNVAGVLLLRFICAVIFSLLTFYVLPLSPEIKKTVIILLFSPIGAMASNYTLKLKGDPALSSFSISLSILVSLVIMIVLYAYL
ncbi:AEC family transporter [Vagococcus elongatus]|uniref:Uncharacterized protein n=1 Tax=Vagococcus elongatus TaxID=180344 RepID=A0A430B4C1_9ENTE|nr:AEC family transporter [Vagococcus elongatus]RSU15187.1 hypothetical protein CBF29_02305 [Vagococcus elongatus]